MSAPELHPPKTGREFVQIVADVFEKETDGVLVSEYRSGRDIEIDIYIVGPEPEAEHIGIECKHSSNINKTDIRNITNQARKFNPPLDRLIVATIAESIPELTPEDGLNYTLEVHSWPDIINSLLSHSDLLDQYYSQLVRQTGVEELREIEDVEVLLNAANRAKKYANHEFANVCYQILLDRAIEEGDREIETTARENLGDIKMNRGFYEEAEKHYRENLQIFHDMGDSQGKSNSLSNLGLIAQNQGLYEEAREYHEESLEIQHELGDREGRANSLGNLGLVARSKGDYIAAREYHEESLAINRELGDRQGEADQLGNLGTVARKQGDYEEAREYHEESLAIKRELGDRQGEANQLGNLGLVARKQGDYEQAREYHEESLAIKRELGDRQGEANQLGNLGLVVQSLGDYEQAQEYHEESLEIKRGLGDRQGVASSLGNLGVVARSKGDYEEAREYFERSLEIKRDLGDRQGVATSLGNLGLIAQSLGDHEEAIDELKEALNIFNKIGAVDWELQTYENLAQIAYEAEGSTEAVDWCERGIERCEEIDLPVADEAERNLRGLRARIETTPERTRELYVLALRAIITNDGEQALSNLMDIWERREQHILDDEIDRLILAAGVGLAAHLSLFKSEGVGDDAEEIIDTIEPHRDTLTLPAEELYDRLQTGTVSVDPKEIVDEATDIEGGEINTENLDLEELEALAYARLLGALEND